MRTNTGIIGIIILLLVCFAAMVLIFQPVSAASDRVYNDEENLDTSTIYVAQQGAKSYPYPIYYVNQGDKVFFGDHIDISGVAQGYQALAWFSKGYPSEGTTAYIIELPDPKYQWYNVYIDQDFFKQYPGNWYKWNGYVEESANQLAFTVKPYTRPANATIIQTINATKIEEQQQAARQLLPEKKVADYLTVHGQYLNIKTMNEPPFRVWIFGTKDYIYQLESDDYTLRITREQIDGLKTGKYTILIQYRGINRGYDVSWNPDKEELGRLSTDAWQKPKILEEAGKQPLMVLTDLKSLLEETDDKYETFSLEVQDPMLQVNGLDFVEVRDAKAYYNDVSLRGNVSIYRVVGYTNVLPMTGVKFALDEDEVGTQNAQWFSGEAKGSDPGAMRQFLVNVPIYKDNMKEGMHTLSGYTSVGGSVYYDFPVNIAPDHSYIPDQDVKYIGDENPWKANLTTVTITIPVPGPTQKIYVNVTPSDEQVRAQQQAVLEKINQDNIAYQWFVLLLFFTIIVGGSLIAYVVYTYYRAKKDEPWKEAM